MEQDTRVDIKENYIKKLDDSLLSILLKDHSSGKNIIWATDNYASKGAGYGKDDNISIFAITGSKGNIIKPRTEKSKQEQVSRIRDKAEFVRAVEIPDFDQKRSREKAWHHATPDSHGTALPKIP